MYKLLTKSNYLVGLKCNRSLWIEKNKPELKPEIDLATQYKFETGHKVGNLAKEYFKGGISISEGNFQQSLKLSKEHLEKRKVLFEAGFLFGRCYSRADVLKPVGKDEWDIIEVKSGTKVKEENIHDVSFQKYVYENSGLKIRNCYLMHLDNTYLKDGDLDIKNLFVLDNITEEVEEYSEGIEDRINYMLENIDSKEYNENKFGKHCDNPKECPNPDQDRGFLPKHSIFTFYNIRVKKAIEYFNHGFLKTGDVTNDFKLNAKQKIQQDSESKNENHVDPKGIKLFLDELKYPLYYIDFETYNPAIPYFNDMKPYQRIPFQVSLHIQNKSGEKLEHYEFLAEDKNDPRKEFIEFMIKHIKDDGGSIVVFNEAFEKGVMKEIINTFPEYTEWVENSFLRFKDLLKVFRDFNYYNPKQEGSCSIKKVLPCLVPEKNHKDLDISNGITASIEYENSIWKSNDKKEISKIRKNLLEYCKLDTLAMVDIKEELEKLIIDKLIERHYK